MAEHLPSPRSLHHLASSTFLSPRFRFIVTAAHNQNIPTRTWTIFTPPKLYCHILSALFTPSTFVAAIFYLQNIRGAFSSIETSVESVHVRLSLPLTSVTKTNSCCGSQVRVQKFTTAIPFVGLQVPWYERLNWSLILEFWSQSTSSVPVFLQ